MKMKNKTGWYEEKGSWYLYHNDKLLAGFCLTEHSNPTKMLYNINVMGKVCEEIELVTGYVNEAKAIIENMIISYTAEQISELQSIRYAVVKAAEERVDKDVRN